MEEQSAGQKILTSGNAVDRAAAKPRRGGRSSRRGEGRSQLRSTKVSIQIYMNSCRGAGNGCTLGFPLLSLVGLDLSPFSGRGRINQRETVAAIED